MKNKTIKILLLVFSIIMTGCTNTEKDNSHNDYFSTKVNFNNLPNKVSKVGFYFEPSDMTNVKEYTSEDEKFTAIYLDVKEILQKSTIYEVKDTDASFELLPTTFCYINDSFNIVIQDLNESNDDKLGKYQYNLSLNSSYYSIKKYDGVDGYHLKGFFNEDNLFTSYKEKYELAKKELKK